VLSPGYPSCRAFQLDYFHHRRPWFDLDPNDIFDSGFVYMLKPKGRMGDDWTRRYLLPTTTPEYALWKKRPKAHQGQTVMMKRLDKVDPKDANPGA
jgi:hypothetical protein